MKKIIINIVLILTILCSTCNTSYAATPTLSEIVNKFNNSTIVETYENAGGSIIATHDVDSITITVTVDDEQESVELLLEGNILSIEIDQNESIGFLKSYITLSIIDIIGQLHGYEEGELAATVNSDEAYNNYTLEKEGFEIKDVSETKFKLMVDISKKIPLADFSNTYIEVSDLDFQKDYLYGDGSTESRKGNIYIHKDGYDGDNTVIVAEKKALSDNTYKSILSVLEVMFDSKDAVKYFESNYSDLSIGNKEFRGLKVEINPPKTDWETTLLGADNTYKFVRLSIDKNTVNSLLNISDSKPENNTNTNTATNNNNNNTNKLQQSVNKVTDSINKLPQTGKFFKSKDGLISLSIISSIFLIIFIIKDIKYKNINKK